ncbi:MAG TPA: hypothetical protein VLS44_11780 [Nitrospira sp.]|nr:hypothetical protein [Nitrospira sp.]
MLPVRVARGQACGGPHAALSSFQRAKGFPAAGDFRRAIEVCRADVSERPSASSYVALPSVYHALDACLDSLAEADRWLAVESLAQSLPAGGPKELLDSRDMLPRIGKALISSSVKLDEQAVAVLWGQQQVRREHRRGDWWFGVPEEWTW